ncbi:MAG: glycoside hydrolase family 3 N-terminal domain-containing protein, partial [Terricaulis sp.]
MDAPAGRVAIPVIWGSDAVHGNAQHHRRTIFPHNIGLGATRDPELLRRIGENHRDRNARGSASTGPSRPPSPSCATIAGAALTKAIRKIRASCASSGRRSPKAFRGVPGAPDFLRGPHIIATAKHFLGDGGTD